VSKRTKTLSLYRAFFGDGFNGTLEQIARAVFLKLQNAKDRRKDTDLFSFIVFASLEEVNGGGGLFLRVFEAEEGGTGVIDLDTTDSAKAVEEFFHPESKRFLKEEVIFLITDDTILACNCKNKAGTLIGNMGYTSPYSPSGSLISLS